MKYSLTVFLLFVFTICINAQDFTQDDQGAGMGAGIRHLRPGVTKVNQTPGILKTQRAVRKSNVTGVRRLVPVEYATIQAAIMPVFTAIRYWYPTTPILKISAILEKPSPLPAILLLTVILPIYPKLLLMAATHLIPIAPQLFVW